MAAILKREGEQQEKERQKQAALQQAQQQRLLQEQQARQQAELQRQQLQRQQEQLQRQQEELRQQQAAAQQKTQQEALQRQQQMQAEQQRQQQEAAAKQQQQLAQQAAQQQIQQQRSQSSTPGSQQGGSIELLPSGLGGLSLGESTSGGSPTANISHQQGSEATVGSPTSGGFDATSSYLGALDESFLHCPSNADSERQRTYTPRNPYPTPSSYPTAPSLIFENPAIFEKLGTDCLFFIFYYAQGTYQQYLAARELKKQSWRYHKKYMTWFQRHEEPKVTTEDYEQGTYVYFDYESGWCQRIKSDFRFEYSYLEDSLQ